MKLSVLVLLLTSYSLMAQIAVDGFYGDWKQDDFQIPDENDQNFFDITTVWVSNDEEHLYIRIDVDTEFDLQDAQNISILIDADNDPSTGFSSNGIGAEISYYFGNRQAFLNYPTGFLSTNHAQIGLVALPTVTSKSFEMMFSRRPSSSLGDIEMSETIAISIENSSSGDKVPNTSGGFTYTLQDKAKFTSSYSFSKTEDKNIRLLSYNILRDGFLDPIQKPHLENVISAINPDIIAFQEIYDMPPSTIQDFLNEALPNEDGSSWDFAKQGPDVVVFARGQILEHDNIDGNGVFMVTDAVGENPIILYNVHLPCCDRDFDRQQEVDKILSIIRDRGSNNMIDFTYPENTPLVIAGDFNFVGESQNITSFLEGDIVDESSFGGDFTPDWDDSFLEDANPYVSKFPSNYTWRSNTSSYNPGKLDFVFYSGSVMTQQNSFVLATEFLSQEELNEIGLSESSTGLASDHLPVVVDFSLGLEDADMDGFTSDVDCDDANPSINPDASEIANNEVDEDCDGITLIIDEDMDGFNSDDDCDDTDAGINPDASEIANNEVDEDCDGITLIIDEDMDGFNSDDDCDDMDASINPEATEIANNEVDEDCDGITLIIDDDMDGFNSDVDCDDTNAEINPGQVEVPNNDVDENCDGELGIVDNDMDGFSSDVDCNDGDPEINPDAIEVANNEVDENCDGEILVIDEDMDGFNSDEDCDDANAEINPDGTEIPNNGIDEDCDGEDLTSTTKNAALESFQVRPNPAREFLIIDHLPTSFIDLSIFNLDGRMLINQQVNSRLSAVEIADLPRGFYVLKLENEHDVLLLTSFIKM